MIQVVIIADDLTGANANGVLLARQGFKTATFLHLENAYGKSNKFSVISMTTDSRGIAQDQAYAKVKEVVKFFKDQDIKFFSKRIDSTLRGNIGGEIDAVLDELGEDQYAIVVPVYPDSGRIAVGGYLMVDSVPLEQTEVAKDPKTPVKHSYIPDIIREQTKYPVGFIPLDKTLKGVETLRKSILEEKDKGNRIIVIDATTNEDIDLIARAVKKTKLKVTAVDPGPFTSALAKELVGEPVKAPGQKAMLVVGSVTSVTRRQLEKLRLEYDPLLIKVNAENLIYQDTFKEEVNRVVDLLFQDIDDYEVVGLVTTEREDQVLNLKEHADKLGITEDEAAQRISDGLAKMTKIVMERGDSLIGGLLTSGGDITVAVCKEFESTGIEVKDEVFPLAAYGRVIGGKYDNIPIITKGGLVGEPTAIIKSVEYLLTKISNEYH